MAEDGPDTRDLGALTTAAVRMLRLSHHTVEHAPDMIFWLDESGSIRRANEAACSAFGLTPADFRSRRFSELVDGNGEAVFRAMWQAEPGPSMAARECQMRLPTGVPLPVEVAVCRVDFDGQTFNCAFVRDIRARKDAEHALREALDQIEAYKNRLEAENVYLRAEIKL